MYFNQIQTGGICIFHANVHAWLACVLHQQGKKRVKTEDSTAGCATARNTVEQSREAAGLLMDRARATCLTARRKQPRPRPTHRRTTTSPGEARRGHMPGNIARAGRLGGCRISCMPSANASPRPNRSTLVSDFQPD